MQNKKGSKQVSGAADTVSTLPRRGIRSGADWIACTSVANRQSFLNDLTEGELLALPFLFEFWAMEHQLPPAGDWRSWVIMGAVEALARPEQGRNGCAAKLRVPGPATVDRQDVLRWSARRLIRPGKLWCLATAEFWPAHHRTEFRDGMPAANV